MSIHTQIDAVSLVAIVEQGKFGVDLIPYETDLNNAVDEDDLPLDDPSNPQAGLSIMLGGNEATSIKMFHIDEGAHEAIRQCAIESITQENIDQFTDALAEYNNNRPRPKG